MSGWNFRRVKEGLRQAVGISQAIEDDFFDEQIRAWEARVTDIRKLKENIELFVDAIALSSMATLTLSDSLSKLTVSLSTASDGARESASLFAAVNSDVNNTIHSSLRTVIINRCLKPLMIILTNVSLTYEKINKRKSILLDFNAYSNKVHRESKANNPHLNRTTHKLEDVSKELANLQADILNSVAEMDETMHDTLLTEIANLSASFYYYHHSSAVLMGQMLPALLPQQATEQTQQTQQGQQQHGSQQQQGAATLCLLSMTASSAQPLNSPLLAQRIRTNRQTAAANAATAASWDEVDERHQRPPPIQAPREGHDFSEDRDLSTMLETLRAFESGPGVATIPLEGGRTPSGDADLPSPADGHIQPPKPPRKPTKPDKPDKPDKPARVKRPESEYGDSGQQHLYSVVSAVVMKHFCLHAYYRGR
jgi:hypothetical protein